MKHKLIALFIVVLACCIHAQSSVISIDGDFSDWKNLAEEERVLAEPDENSCYEYLYRLMSTQDSDYIYFYLEFSAEEGDVYVTQDHGYVKGLYVDYLDILIDFDNDSTTGWNTNMLFKESAAEWLIEGSWKNFSEAELVPFDTLSPQGEWGFNDTTLLISCVVASEASIIDNGHRAFEGKIAKNMIPGKMDSVKVGVLTWDIGWSYSGFLPQCTFLESGDPAPSQMLSVPYLLKDLDVTAVEHVKSADDVQCTKVIRDGQLFIVRGEREFNVQGVQVK
ncbi:MAG: hypothetical protein K6A36_03990 [Paludibacteraceae bacterium]|nr:hypothetical protein [Paludibacteraceae bacterium]